MVEDIGRRLNGRNSINICEVEDLLNGNGNNAGGEDANSNGDNEDEDEDEDAIREISECETKVSSGEESVIELDDDASVILVSEPSSPCESLEKCADLWEEDGSIFAGSCSNNSKMEEDTQPESAEVITIDDEPFTSVEVEQELNGKELCESEIERNLFEGASTEIIHFTCPPSHHARGRLGPFRGFGRRGMRRRLTKGNRHRRHPLIVERSSVDYTLKELTKNEDLLETDAEKTCEFSGSLGDNTQCSNNLSAGVAVESDVAAGIPIMKQTCKNRGRTFKKSQISRKRLSKRAKTDLSKIPDSNQNRVVPKNGEQNLDNMDLFSGRRTRSSCEISSASNDLHSQSTNFPDEKSTSADSSCSAVEHPQSVNSCGVVIGMERKGSMNASSRVHHTDLVSNEVARETNSSFETRQNDRKMVCFPEVEGSIVKESYSEGQSYQALATSRPKRQICRPRLLEAFVTPTIRATKIVKRPLESLTLVQKSPVLNPKPCISPAASEPTPVENPDVVSPELVLKSVITESPEEDAQSSPTMPKIKGKKKSKTPAPRKKTHSYTPRKRISAYQDISCTNIQMVSRSRSTPILCVNDELQIGMFYLIAQEVRYELANEILSLRTELTTLNHSIFQGNRMQLMRFNGTTMEPFDTNWVDALRTSAESSSATEEEQHGTVDEKGTEPETLCDSSTHANFTVAA